MGPSHRPETTSPDGSSADVAQIVEADAGSWERVWNLKVNLLGSGITEKTYPWVSL